MSVLPVSEWPQYLLRDIPSEIRAQLQADADQTDVSVTDVIRRILCKRYELFCPPASLRASAIEVQGPTMLIRLQPELKTALVREQEQTGMPRRTIILDALEANYNGKEH